ncbi:SdiA-regulated domain-containing protein, partial [candidate division KSB1 bacterium]|nr:SdiA-regulated domain-containing protein [candidate division KSB1 bacterium]
LLDHVILSEANGFFDDDTDAGKLDFSGIVYDPVRKQFWIVSDKGQRLFLYDRQRNEVVASLALAYQHKNKEREIKKAEGVAIDPAINRLFVVSDKEARLYIYDILR